MPRRKTATKTGDLFDGAEPVAASKTPARRPKAKGSLKRTQGRFQADI